MMTRKFAAVLIAVIAATAAARAADTYKADPAHSSIGFSIAHMVISDVKGRFKEFEGSLTVDGTTATAATATIQAKSIDTDIGKRDDHLRSPDFFDVDKYPTITFESTKVETKDKQQILTGKFTMHGTTKEISLPATVKGPIKDMQGKTRLALKASTTLNRKDYGLTWSKTLETGGLVVGDEVTIEINAEFVKQ